MYHNHTQISAKRKPSSVKGSKRSATNSDNKNVKTLTPQKPRKKPPPKTAIDLIHEGVRSGWGCTIDVESPAHEEVLVAAWECWRLANPRLLKRVAIADIAIDRYDGRRYLRICLKGGILQ
jgi:hypothetical protein